MVAECEHAHGIGMSIDLQHTGGAANAALQPMAGHSTPCANCAHGKISSRIVKSFPHMLFPHTAVTNIIQRRVIAFAHNGVDAAKGDAILLAALNHIADHCIVHKTNIKRVGQRDRRFDYAKFFYLHQSAGLAKAV